MITKIDTGLVREKMEELCSALLAQESFRTLRKMIDRFAEDEAAVAQYERFLEKHRRLQQKEELNLEPTREEVDEYEREERALYDNDVIRRFLYAQREFHHLHQLVSQYITKTVELNRLPRPDDFKSEGCGCGGNCGCGANHH